MSRHTRTGHSTGIRIGTALNPINVFIVTGAITKTGTLATTLHKPVGEANKYFRFEHSPLKIFNHTRGKISVSMNADPIDMIHKSQQYTK